MEKQGTIIKNSVANQQTPISESNNLTNTKSNEKDNLEKQVSGLSQTNHPVNAKDKPSKKKEYRIW
jgi:hypothetical protein